MKKSLLILPLLLHSFVSYCQDRNSVTYFSAGYGIASTNYMLNALTSRARTSGLGTLTLSASRYYSRSFQPRRARRRFSKTIGLSVALSYESEQGKMHETPWTYIKAPFADIGDYKTKTATFIVEVNPIYVSSRSGNFRFYSTYGIGITYQHDETTWSEEYFQYNFVKRPNAPAASRHNTSNSFYPNFSLMPVCFRIGNKLSFFAEFGIGCKGAIFTGLSLKV
ncbi:MAG: hypothetical protein H7257_06825 [Taibaiella sp.]|nr:hypothetical protein [Taibaiella sp.]